MLCEKLLQLSWLIGEYLFPFSVHRHWLTTNEEKMCSFVSVKTEVILSIDFKTREDDCIRIRIRMVCNDIQVCNQSFEKTNNKNKQNTYLTLRRSFLYPGHLNITATIIICSEKEKNVAQF